MLNSHYLPKLFKYSTKKDPSVVWKWFGFGKNDEEPTNTMLPMRLVAPVLAAQASNGRKVSPHMKSIQNEAQRLATHVINFG